MGKAVTPAAIHTCLSAAFDIHIVEPYMHVWRVYVSRWPVTSENAIAKRVERAGLVYVGRGWDLERGYYMIVGEVK